MRAALCLVLILSSSSAAFAAGGPYAYYPVDPCRLAAAAYGLDSHYTTSGTALDAGAVRVIAIAGNCAVPADAKVVLLNMTVVGPSGAGMIVLWASGTAFPSVSNLNFVAGETLANSAAVQLGADGKMNAVAGVSNVASLIVDVQGYFK